MKNILIKIRNNHEQLFRIFLFLLTLAIIIYVFPKQAKFKYEFTKGKPWMHETIIAPFDFSILKSVDEIKIEQEIIHSEHTPIFNYNSDIFLLKAEDYIIQFEEKWVKDKNVKKDDKFTFSNLFKKRKIDNSTRKYNLAVFGYDRLQAIFEKGIVQLHGDFEYKKGLNVLLKKGGIAEKTSIDQFLSISSSANEINLIDNLTDEEYSFLIPLLLSSLEHNITYDKLASEAMLQSDLKNINNTHGLIVAGQVIVSKGELVTAERYQKLFSLKQKYEGKKWNLLAYYLMLLGQIILVGLSLLILFLFIKEYRVEVLNNTTKISMILSVILLMVVISSLVLSVNLNYIYIVPFCIGPVILKAFFDNRIALFTHMIAILIIGFIVPNGFEFVFLQLIAGIVSILSVLKMYKRSQLFMSVAKVIAVYFVIYISLSITHDGSFVSLDVSILIQLAISGALTLFAYPIIFLFEKIFSLVSDVSLLELTDMNSVLLRRLSEEAPGTFQHSLQVANLAEMGALEIGANALLTRAGAIYHDVGKLKNPMYFIENQSSDLNPHDEIEFDESAEIIISHVLDGVEIAKDNNLPDELIDFIRTHHGTTTVQYFYKQFIADFPKEDIDVKAFTYPGPKPFSKETVILMMADSAEASSRSLKNPTAENIDVLIERVINKQIEDGQFVNADITLKEITQLKKLFKKKLVNIHHARVEY
ncbi:MAG: HDIG domain-containing protein [Flavobacteriales bacterium]|nr:HDIG domain-containing protein [Flavobacteriales bacterium]